MTFKGAIFHTRLRPAMNYIILIPAFLFFIALGLPRRFERAVGYAMVGLGGILQLLSSSATPRFMNALTASP